MSAWAAITSEYGSHVNVHYFGLALETTPELLTYPSILGFIDTYVYHIQWSVGTWANFEQTWGTEVTGVKLVVVYRMTLGQPALNGRGRAETHKSTFQIFFISSRDAMWNSALAKLPAWFQGHLRVKSANCHAGQII